jgi:hypothetical protein
MPSRFSTLWTGLWPDLPTWADDLLRLFRLLSNLGLRFVCCIMVVLLMYWGTWNYIGGTAGFAGFVVTLVLAVFITFGYAREGRE